MTEIYILVVKRPPTKEKGCRDCQFEDDFYCGLEGGNIPYSEGCVPDWCPLQKVEVRK